LAGLALIALLVPLFVNTFVQGGIIPDISAIALEPFARGVGAAAAILGTTQFLLGALIPPLVSLGGTSAVVMGVTITLCMTAALALMLIQAHGRRHAAPAPGVLSTALDEIPPGF
jgi:DHA1 family bicyclomycin/chloramphenicol resistance-like MFS transporter